MISITTEVGRGLAKRGETDVRKALDGAAAVLAMVLGETVKRRVSEQANVAGQRVSDWDAAFKGIMVAARYPGADKGVATRSGARRFETNKAFHEAIGSRLGAYPMTGLSRVIRSSTSVDLLFRGRSEGQDGRIINGKSRPLKVSNALKAWTVREKKNVNLLAMTEDELRAIEAGIAHTVAFGISGQLPVEWQAQGAGAAAGSVEAIFRTFFRTPRGAPLPDAAPGM